MSDIDTAISLVKSGKLSTDQCMLYHLTGMLRPVPGAGVDVTFVTDVAPYVGGERAEFHAALAEAFVARYGVAVYA
jgi:hypothetical protein